MQLRSRLARVAAGVVVAALGLAFPARPLAAAPPDKAPVAPAQAPIAAAAAAKVGSLTPARLASLSAQTAATPSTNVKPSFFKTGRGIAVLILMVAGVGYASYSAVNDRDPVRSPIR